MKEPLLVQLWTQLYNHWTCIIIILIIIALLILSILRFRHCPRKKLPDEIREEVIKYGLMHFTLKENVGRILSEGVTPDKKRALSRYDKNMVWTYIAKPSDFYAKLTEVHSKGKRSAYDAVVFIHDIPEEALSKIRYREKPEAIVYLGTLKTDHMRAKIIQPPKTIYFSKSIEALDKKGTQDILLMQWNKLADQVEAINSDHWKVFTIMVTALGISSLSNNTFFGLPPFIIMLPILAMIVIVYEAYRINELAIAEGYLSKIEEALNAITIDSESLEEATSNKEIPLLVPPAQWYSRYFIKYSSGKNKVKKYVFVPVLIAILFVVFICVGYLFKSPWKSLPDKTKVIYIIYICFCVFTAFIDGMALCYIKKCEKIKGDVRYDNLEPKDFEYLWLQDKHYTTRVRSRKNKNNKK